MVFTNVVAHVPGRRPQATDRKESPFPRSLVTVLTEETELRQAVDRAIEFERNIATHAEAQISRYEGLATPRRRNRRKGLTVAA